MVGESGVIRYYFIILKAMAVNIVSTKKLGNLYQFQHNSKNKMLPPQLLMSIQNCVNLLANTICARAEEDELDDVVDIEGEDNQVVGEDVGDEDDSIVKSSQDIDTTILFTKPVPNFGDSAFGERFFQWFLHILNLWRCLEFVLCSLSWFTVVFKLLIQTCLVAVLCTITRSCNAWNIVFDIELQPILISYCQTVPLEIKLNYDLLYLQHDFIFFTLIIM